MSDLLNTLPDFDVKPYSHLLHSLEKNDVTVTDLITLDPVEIARKCPLPLLDVRHLASDIVEALQKDLKMLPTKQSTSSELLAPTSDDKPSSNSVSLQLRGQDMIFVKTLDSALDKQLGGGFPVGYVTEVVGESAVGKTQFLMGLLLSVQIPVPYGIGKAAIYLSTEDDLNTTRLEQMLNTHPAYRQLSLHERPSFDHVHTLKIKSLEAQQRVIEYQLPIAIKRYDAGLVVLDSVAANYRAEHETTTANAMGDRAADLMRLGVVLRRVATEHKVAVVVANQVSDRFADNVLPLLTNHLRSSSPAASSMPTSQSSSLSGSLLSERNTKMTLDHQQRFFTGWGDRPGASQDDLKTPALGLAWANQVAARVVLKVQAEGSGKIQTESPTKRRRFVSLVFASWAPNSSLPVEYTIEAPGVVSVDKPNQSDDYMDLLDESLWDEDEEFP